MYVAISSYEERRMRYRRVYRKRHRDGSVSVVTVGPLVTGYVGFVKWFLIVGIACYLLVWPWSFHWPLTAEILTSAVYYPTLAWAVIAGRRPHRTFRTVRGLGLGSRAWRAHQERQRRSHV